tara:strand:+ start:2227 stop:2844 length:618 start_codon:yes stop_codon:yes gene_type:complete
VQSFAVQAGKIDAERVAIVHSINGLQLVEQKLRLSQLFDFSPLTNKGRTRLPPGFSDPLGTGSEHTMTVFSGAVQNMDILGDFHPSNPFDPTEVAPTLESLQTSFLVNLLVYSAPLPAKSVLVSNQLNLMYSPKSELSERPKTIETSPLNLAGFGSVKEHPGPVSLHWTQCPDYEFKRYLMNKTTAKKASPTLRRNRPRPDCFVI